MNGDLVAYLFCKCLCVSGCCIWIVFAHVVDKINGNSITYNREYVIFYTDRFSWFIITRIVFAFGPTMIFCKILISPINFELSDNYQSKDERETKHSLSIGWHLLDRHWFSHDFSSADYGCIKNITCKHKGCLCILTRLIFSPIFKKILMILKANIKHFECVRLKCTTFIRDQR